MKRLAILGSGAGTTAAAIIDAAKSESIFAEVCVVIGNNSNSGILGLASALDVPTAHLSGLTHPGPPENLDSAILRTLQSAGTDLVILTGYMKKLGPAVLEHYSARIVNIHPALLPAYGGKGMYGDRVHAAVLADGVELSGVTLHQVTAEYDEGPILAQVTVPVNPDDDVTTLRVRVQSAERRLVLRWLRQRCGADPADRPS